MCNYTNCTHANNVPVPEGWIVVGVDNISEHFIYRVCSHIKDKTGEWLRKGSNSFFFLPTLLLGLYLLCLQMDGEFLESVKKISNILFKMYQLIQKTVHFCNPSSCLSAHKCI